MVDDRDVEVDYPSTDGSDDEEQDRHTVVFFTELIKLWRICRIIRKQVYAPKAQIPGRWKENEQILKLLDAELSHWQMLLPQQLQFDPAITSGSTNASLNGYAGNYVS